MLPHPPITPHYARAEEKPVFVNRLFDAAAKHYDSVTGWGFLGSGSFYRRWVQRRHGLRPGMHLLDVACGTGLMAVEAARLLGTAEHITCLDPSEGMMAEAKKKLPARFIQGYADALPLPDASFDFLTMGYALRHVADLERTMREYHRVLRPGGRALILEVTKPAGRVGNFFFRLYFGKIYPGLTRLFTGSQAARDMMRYYWETMDAAVPPEQILAAMRAAGFAEVKCQRLMGLFCEFVATKAPAPSAPS